MSLSVVFIVMFVNAIFCWRQSKPGNLPDISEKSPRTPTSPKTPSEKDDDSFFDDPLPDNSREKEISGYVCFNSNNTLHVCVCVCGLRIFIFVNYILTVNFTILNGICCWDMRVLKTKSFMYFSKYLWNTFMLVFCL